MSAQTWTADDEAKFVKELDPETRAKYFSAFKLRHNWGSINYDRLMVLLQDIISKDKLDEFEPDSLPN